LLTEIVESFFWKAVVFSVNFFLGAAVLDVVLLDGVLDDGVFVSFVID